MRRRRRRRRRKRRRRRMRRRLRKKSRSPNSVPRTDLCFFFRFPCFESSVIWQVKGVWYDATEDKWCVRMSLPKAGPLLFHSIDLDLHDMLTGAMRHRPTHRYGEGPGLQGLVPNSVFRIVAQRLWFETLKTSQVDLRGEASRAYRVGARCWSWVCGVGERLTWDGVVRLS